MPSPELRNLRTAYGEALVRLMEEDERIVALDADLCRSTMTVLAEQRFPNRFIEMGIAEQNMMATAVGLALEDKIPFVNSFAVFTCGRAYDQIRLGIALGQLGVTIVGSSAGLSDFGDGATHQSVEDVSLMASLPNMTIISPSDALDVEQVLPLIVAARVPAAHPVRFAGDSPRFAGSRPEGGSPAARRPRCGYICNRRNGQQSARRWGGVTGARCVSADCRDHYPEATRG